MRSLLAAALVAVTLGSGLLACSGDIGEPETEGSPGSSSGGNPVAQAITPAPGGVRKLTGRQYVGSIRVLLGDTVAAVADDLVAHADPPINAAVSGFDAIGAAQLSISPTHVDQFEQFAAKIADAAVSDPAILKKLVPCAATGPGDIECHKKFVTSFGRLAWRRPLTDDEVALMTGVAHGAAIDEKVNDFNKGVYYALTAFLQSPYFLYIVELGNDDAADPAKRRLTDLELLSRMSFFILSRTPDPAMLDEVEKNKLDTDDKVRALAETFVKLPDAKAALEGFYAEIFRLRELATDVTKNATLFPTWSTALGESMKEETLHLLDDIVWKRNTDARELFDADYTYVDSNLAALYGVSAPATPWTKVTLPAIQRRAGFLGQASFLARQSTATRTSATRRGLFIQSVLLCNEIPPPPVGVNTVLPENDPNKPMTLKQKLEQHEKDAQCGACHKRMDPVGFALENFDAIGAFRTTDNGLPIDSTATVEGIGSFDSAKALGAILRNDERGAVCMMKNLFRNSMGHLETTGEKPALDALDESFGKSEYKIQELLVDIAASPAFQLVGAPK